MSSASVTAASSHCIRRSRSTYFGARNASGIIGVLYTGGAAGSFLGPKLAGDAFDSFGSYTIPIAIGAACALLAVVFVIAAPEPDLAPPP